MRNVLIPALVSGLLLACGDTTSEGGGGNGGRSQEGGNGGQDTGGNGGDGFGGNDVGGGGGKVGGQGGTGGQAQGGQAQGGEGGQGGGAQGVCGDGAIDGGEGCDDGGTADADGCSATCAVEHGWTCDNSSGTSDCSATCGDGVVAAPAEECDDGDTATGDGCDDSCQVESGYSCDTSEPSQCMTGCGDGVIAGTEECDDGDMVGSDGCSATCVVEGGWDCTGEPSNCTQLAGAACSNPIVATDGFTFTGADIGQYGDDLNFTDATCTNVSGTPNTSPEIVFSVDLGAGDHLNVTNFGTEDVVWQVVPSCAAQACSATYDSVPGPGGGEQTLGLNYTAPSAGTYFVIVESFFSGASLDPTETYDLRFAISTCGDGILGAVEECDDANPTANDGCTACIVDGGYSCTGEPSTCTSLQGAGCNDPIVASDGFQYTGDDIGQFGDDYDFTDATCTNVAGMPNTSPEMIFSVDLIAGQRLSIKNFGTLDAVWQLVPTCAPQACSATYDGFPGAGGGEQTIGLGFLAPSDGTYFVAVESYFEGATLDPADTYDLRFEITTCGDGIVDAGEPCDDGNLNPNDGCSPLCVVEPGYTCNGQPSTCTSLPPANCANPLVVTGKSLDFSGTNFAQFGNDDNFSAPATCHDVSTIAGSGADVVFRADLLANDKVRIRELGSMDSVVHILQPPSCAGGTECVASYDDPEPANASYTATQGGPVYLVGEAYGAPGAATFDFVVDISRCGDGQIDWAESCDDGNTNNGDGCSSTCGPEYQCVALSAETEPNEDGTPSLGGSGQQGNDFSSVNVNGAVCADATITGAISPDGDEDVYAIKNPTAAPVLVTFETSVPTPGTCTAADTVIAIRDAGGGQLALDDDGGVGNCSLVSYTIPANGLVFAHVIEYGDNASIAGYTLTVGFP